MLASIVRKRWMPGLEDEEMERIVVITGASSGLGLAFAKHYAAQPSTRVFIQW